jgi:hypothetical protein
MAMALSGSPLIDFPLKRIMEHGTHHRCIQGGVGVLVITPQSRLHRKSIHGYWIRPGQVMESRVWFGTLEHLSSSVDHGGRRR